MSDCCVHAQGSGREGGRMGVSAYCVYSALRVSPLALSLEWPVLRYPLQWRVIPLLTWPRVSAGASARFKLTTLPGGRPVFSR